MTYLNIVNNVLRRMREEEVSSIQENTYAKMVGDFVNDAKRTVEDAWDWSALRTTLTITTAGMTQGLSDWLESTDLITTTQEQADRYLELAAQYGENSAAGQAAMEAYNRLTQGLEAVGTLGESSDVILNLANDAGWLANSIENLAKHTQHLSLIHI